MSGVFNSERLFPAKLFSLLYSSKGACSDYCKNQFFVLTVHESIFHMSSTMPATGYSPAVKYASDSKVHFCLVRFSEF